MKTAFFVLIRALKNDTNHVISGPHSSFADASLASQEINSNLVSPPFAYVRRTANAAMTQRWLGNAA